MSPPDDGGTEGRIEALRPARDRLAAAWSFEEHGGGGTVTELVSGRTDPITTAVPTERGGPWLSDPQGRALVLDGYSTWVTAPAASVDLGGGSFAVRAWFAAQAFGASNDALVMGIASQLDGPARRGFELGVLRSGRAIGRVGVGTRLVEVASNEPLALGRWCLLDLRHDARTGLTSLEVDGIRASVRSPAGTAAIAAVTDLLLGRSSEPSRVDGTFVEGVACGLLGAVEIHSSTSVEPSFAAALPRVRLPTVEERFRDDPHRPRYHLMPTRHWMNEPHGAICVDGTHHVFFQHNPRGPFFGSLHWGHAVSDDLAHWRIVQPALAPHTTPEAPDGVWSGSATTGPDGQPWLLFTAGDECRQPNQAVALARGSPLDDDAGFAFEPLGVVNELDTELAAPYGRLLPGEFRDPYVWRDGDVWWQLVGAGIQDVGGTALLYRSADLRRWEPVGPLLVGDVARFPRTGEMWELPTFLPVGPGPDGRPRHALFVAPWWSGHSEHHLTYVWHWTGVFDTRTGSFTVDTEQPRHFDIGGHFTGPSGTVLPDGRAVLWSIAQDGRDAAAHADSGWAHNAGLPLHVRLGGDGALRVSPLEEQAALRRRQLVAEHPQEAPVRLAWTHRTSMLEIDLRARLEPRGHLQLALRATPDREQQTVLTVAGNGAVTIARERCAPGGDGSDVRTGHVTAHDGGEFSLRVFVDHSMVEAYLNESLSVTTRSYPSRADALSSRLELDGGQLGSLRIWELTAAVELAPGTAEPRRPDGQGPR